MNWSTLVVVTALSALLSTGETMAQEQMAQEPTQQEKTTREEPIEEEPTEEATTEEEPTEEATTPPEGTEATALKNSTNTLRLPKGAASPPAKISDMAWLTGYWRGPGLGGECEEIWSHPLDGRMFGTFVLAQEGKVAFSEAMVLVEEKGSLVLKVKHFDPNFIGWEEKDGFVRFPLAKLEDNVAYFNGLTLRRSGDSLAIYLVIHQKGTKGEVEFQFERISF